MIQRIQSIYLLLVTVLLSFLLLRPYAELDLSNGQKMSFYPHVIVKVSTTGEHQNVKKTVPLILTIIFTGLLSFINIFLYSRRILQIRLCIISTILLVSILIIMVAYYSIEKAAIDNVRYFFKVTALSPIVGIIMNILAYRAIQGDEILVNSYNRLR